MSDHRSRNLIRLLTATALGIALGAFATAPLPNDLPAYAFQQEHLYRLEVALFVFYGALLLVTPAFSGLIHGRLPIEISARGAKFADENNRSAQLNEAAIKELERSTKELAERLNVADFEIRRLKKRAACDRSQPALGSEG